MFENPRRGRQATSCNKCSENSRSQIVFRTDIFRRLTLGAPVQLSLYKSFRTSSFTIVYVFAEKAVLWMSALQMSGENRNHLESPLGVWTNPVYKISWASLPAKQAITVGSSSGLTWTCYMIGVILIFQSVCQKNTFAWCLHHVCVTHYCSANQEFVGRQRPQKWTKRVLIAAVPYPLSPIPQSLSLSPFLTIPSRRLLRRLWHNVIYF